MKQCYAVNKDSIAACAPEQAALFVYTSPDIEEKQHLMEEFGLDRHDIESALDPDEISRVEMKANHTFIVWKIPKNVSIEKQIKFDVASIGLLKTPTSLTIIVDQDALPLDEKPLQRAGSINMVILKIFLQTVHHYFGHLKTIKMLTSDIQAKLNKSMENRYFLQMFGLSESLVYYQNAIEANNSALAKLRANGAALGFTAEELALVEDISIEYQQCVRQTQIYSSVLSGLMDARGNIVNNNMNVLLKDLTLINVVFLPLNLVASIGGMSEYSAMTSHVPWWISYSSFFAGMGVLGWLTWKVLQRRMERRRY